MRIIASAHSSFPRVGDRPEEQKLRRAFAGLEKGKITEAEYKSAQDELISEILTIQESAGIEIVTDGLIRWYDHASHLARNLNGFEINGLLRFFDTNTYFRQPIISDKISGGNGAMADEAGFLAEKTSRTAKAVILGPYSMMRMSQNSSSINREELIEKLGTIIGSEISRMGAAGAAIVQVEEPFLIREPGGFDLFAAGFKALNKARGNTPILPAFYFGDCGKILDRLVDLPADILGLDFTYSPGLLEKIAVDGFPKPIAFGIIDGRNTRMESAGDIARAIEKAMVRIKGDTCHITSSCGLEFLPRDYAIAKLELTSKTAKLLNG